MRKLLERLLKEAGFTDPFVGKANMDGDLKFTEADLKRAIRQDIAAEEEAIHLYTAHSQATDNELAKKVLTNIANEEKVHVFELQKLLNVIDPTEDDFKRQGEKEVEDITK